MTPEREAWNQKPSWGMDGPCPDCGSKATHPTPNCGCPPSPTGYGTRHINLWHHTCKNTKTGGVDGKAGSPKPR